MSDLDRPSQLTHIPYFSIQFLLHWLLYYSLIWSTSSDSVPLKSEYLPWILQFVLLILHFLLLDTLSPTPIPVLSFSVLFSWSHGHPDVPHEYLSVPIQYSISLMMKPDRKLWKQSVWSCNIIVIRNVLNRLNRSKAGKKSLLWIANIRRSFFLAPFWHRWSDFSVFSLFVLRFTD